MQQDRCLPAPLRLTTGRSASYIPVSERLPHSSMQWTEDKGNFLMPKLPWRRLSSGLIAEFWKGNFITLETRFTHSYVSTPVTSNTMRATGSDGHWP
ncbi:hypothetical protein MauCBS54593_007695 [Microsporum audouinii]